MSVEELKGTDGSRCRETHWAPACAGVTIKELRRFPMRDRTSFVFRMILCAGLLVGTTTHVMVLLPHGLSWDYGGVPWFTQAYWTSLTFLDPLAALLLLVRPRLGLLLTAAIIATDVPHNLWFIHHYDIGFNRGVASQCAFLIFVAATFRRIWRNSPDLRPSPGHASPSIGRTE